jgi:hypothetical protein
MQAAIIQVRSKRPGDPTVRAISAETIKMPEPIIDPATRVVELTRPIFSRTGLSSTDGTD